MRVWDMQSRVTLRWLIVLDILANVISAFWGTESIQFGPLGPYSEPLLPLWTVAPLGISLLLLMPTSWIGMWCLLGSSRWLYVATWIVSLVVRAGEGGQVVPAFGPLFNILPGLTGGFFLCYVFTGEGRALFHVKRLADGLHASSKQ